MGIFRFKHFEVINERSAMKVNTDGVLLGASMTIRPEDRRMLDIGTGTGTIALMAAQRFLRLATLAQNDRGDVPLAQNDRGGAPLAQNDIKVAPLDRNDRDVAPLDRNDGEMASIDWRDRDEASLDRSDSEMASLDRSDLVLRRCEVEDGREGHRMMIDAIDVDEPSVQEAAANFRNSPWADHLAAHHMSLDEYAASVDARYDLIFSNPPYFEDSLTAPDERKSTARHTSEGLSYRDIFGFASDHLTADGRISLVLPSDQENDLCRYARMSGFHLFRIMRVRTVPRKAPSRIIAEFSRARCETPEDFVLTIQNEGKYTQEYLSLTRDFYMFA